MIESFSKPHETGVFLTANSFRKWMLKAGADNRRPFVLMARTLTGQPVRKWVMDPSTGELALSDAYTPQAHFAAWVNAHLHQSRDAGYRSRVQQMLARGRLVRGFWGKGPDGRPTIVTRRGIRSHQEQAVNRLRASGGVPGDVRIVVEADDHRIRTALGLPHVMRL